MSPNGWLCVPFQKCGSGRELRFVTFCSSIIVTHSLSFMHGSKKPTEHPPPCRASRCLLYWVQSVTPLSKICLTIKMYHRYFSRQVRNHHFCFFCLAALPQTLYPHFHEIMEIHIIRDAEMLSCTLVVSNMLNMSGMPVERSPGL